MHSKLIEAIASFVGLATLILTWLVDRNSINISVSAMTVVAVGVVLVAALLGLTLACRD